MFPIAGEGTAPLSESYQHQELQQDYSSLFISTSEEHFSTGDLENWKLVLFIHP